MDAESRRRRRESSISLREQRWSMSSQRLEQIVAELMKPVSHYGQSFDRDDSGLLEEYLTAAGLRALAAVEAGGEAPLPNYAEMGLVLQSFANNYCRKVDHLSRLVNSFSQTLDVHNVPRTPDVEVEAEAEVEAGAADAGGARRRRASSSGGGGGGAGFAAISLEPAAGARRGGAAAGPPPTLPRAYAELQPRAAAERALLDYDDEPIGALDDFRSVWRLHNGYLVEELAEGSAEGAELRPLSLMELQEACARAAAPALSPRAPHTPPPSSRRSPSPSPPPPPPPPPAAMRRKRRCEVHVEDQLDSPFTIDLEELLRESASASCEFSVPERWVRRVVRHRRNLIRAVRELASPPRTEFRGFDMSWMDIGGFPGWAGAEGAEGAAVLRAMQRLLDSDDDGFYERSSSLEDSSYSFDPDNQVLEGAEGAESEAQAWQRSLARLVEAAATAAPLDLEALARDVSRALPSWPQHVCWLELLADTQHLHSAARVLLDVLMKASRGELVIRQHTPLLIGMFTIFKPGPESEDGAPPAPPASPASTQPASPASPPPASPASPPPASPASPPPPADDG